MAKVQIVEVGPRDGLQNESVNLPAEVKIEFVRKLIAAGAKCIEAGAFVSAQKIPQMAESAEVFKTLGRPRGVKLMGLVPNERGMTDALAAGVGDIAIFTAASETFSQKNINCSVEESFERFAPVMALAKKHKIKVRGYVSMVFGCPYEGVVSERKVVEVTRRLLKIGCYEVSLGDTIGVATPKQVHSLLKKMTKGTPVSKLAMHFHDTRGTALANIATSLENGVRTFDSSLGGIGGCPYAAGATGNVATEDVVYLLHGMGLKTGLRLEELIQINTWIREKLGRDLPSRVARAKSIPSYIR